MPGERLRLAGGENVRILCKWPVLFDVPACFRADLRVLPGIPNSLIRRQPFDPARASN